MSLKSGKEGKREREKKKNCSLASRAKNRQQTLAHKGGGGKHLLLSFKLRREKELEPIGTQAPEINSSPPIAAKLQSSA